MIPMAHTEAAGYLQALDALLLQPQYPVPPGGLQLGRDADTCQVILSRDFVSRRHCRITMENGEVIVEDLGTTNGTYVNGKRVKRQALEEGDALSLGTPDQRHFIFSRRAGARLRETTLPLREVYRIGRAPDNDLPLSNDPTVSSFHARLRIAGGRITIEDLNSANGTYVNGERIRRREITARDEVRIGSSDLIFSLDAAGLHAAMRDKRNQIQLQACDLCREHGPVKLLRDVNLVIEPGEFVGVLGPSGAGKSTLLNALCGFQPGTGGQVLLNGTPLYSHFDMFRNTLGYVPQDDIIYRELSAERSLEYTARLRLPTDNAEQIRQNVTSVIETLGLAHVRANSVSRLSGGQRKRVSIGCELLTRPSILFLDEPTSGLDPSTEEKLMRHFGQMASQGQTVVVTTHILYNLDLLNLVVIMARGRLVYFGPVSELCGFFSTPERSVSRPIEVFDVLEPEAGGGTEARERAAEAFEAKYRQSRLFEDFVAKRGAAPVGGVPAARIDSKPERTGVRRNVKGLFDTRQLMTLIKRMFDLKLSAASRLIVPLATPIVLALLTGSIDIARGPFDKQEQALRQMEGVAGFPIPLSVPLMMVMTAVFLGTLSACLEISGERPIYLRERAVNLKIPLYISAKLPYLFLLSIVQCFLYVAVTALLLRFEDVNLLTVVAVTSAVACASTAIGLFISSLDPSPGQNSVILAVVAVLPQMIFSGALGPRFYNGLSKAEQGLAALLPARWGFEWMLTALYQQPEWARDFITGDNRGHMGFRFGAEVTKTNPLALAAIAALFLIAACASQRRYDKL